MYEVTLSGQWEMYKTGTDERYVANVPTTMYQVLYENNAILDPYIGENDNLLTQISDDDYTFERGFQVSDELLAHKKVIIEFLGLDTLADIYINNEWLAFVENMHQTYEFDIKDLLVVGENSIRIEFKSPTVFIAKEQAKKPVWGVANPMDGYEYMRKAHHMFGWDWGPRLPDMGIWRDVSIKAYDDGIIDNFYITQNHTEDRVVLDVAIECDLFSDDNLEVSVNIMSPEGELISNKKVNAKVINKLSFDIESPLLWWPNGYGDQPLYKVEVELLKGDMTCDSMEKRIGLRTMTMTREGDAYGESFDMTVNGVRIFALGADYIPEDILICKMDRDRTSRLLDDCVRANYNHIRVWGGAFYPYDYFYDLCDEKGLLIWQDFMFACGVYRLTERFEASIRKEIIDNVKRIRHHASLGLWCGNNEMEWGFEEWDLPDDAMLRVDYLRLYEQLIPDILAELDPNTFYWPASPSSGGGFDNPNSDEKGDVHYWNIFHGGEHYKAFRQHYFRFASEFGMQSFPDMDTINTYAKENEQQIYGPVMEDHNKCWGDVNGNMKIMLNASAEFNLPKTLEDIVYISQVFQGETIKAAVEHLRRHRGRCMGVTYWQVNDNWPVASWASIDYYGRWKALHYMVKRFYAQVLVSGYEEGTKGYIHVSNEKLDKFKGKLKWQINHVAKGVLAEGKEKVKIPGLTSKEIVEVDIKDFIDGYGDERNIYLSFQLLDEEDKKVGADTTLFVTHKYFNFEKPTINTEIYVEDSKTYLKVKSDVYAKSAGFRFEGMDVLLSDNYFDLLPDKKYIVEIEMMNGASYTSEELADALDVKSVGGLDYL